MQYFAAGALAGNLLLRAAPRSLPKVYVVSLVSKDISESETLAVFTDSEKACDYAESLSYDYNRHEWFIRIEEFELDSTQKEPTLEDNPDEELYPCLVEWENT